ncbi:uncharacterized protein LOC111270926 [Varroa jacobsoni]|uniref:uncharacterized protein LOC111270926 n=1 Tax=Varroa jacobsoni TaxID=62625 RepID=UPI000BF9FB2A|nr:uncharacterized protein LOC111270926 [Varroa jacobsoni]
MNWYWVAAAGMLLSLSVGVTAVVLQRFYFQYALIDIMAIIGFMIFTSTLVSLILTRLGFAFKRLLARSQWADMLGIITFRNNSALMSQRPAGCFPCQPSPTQPAFCPDNSGDMLTIFEDYSQYPPQPRRLFDTHRLSPTTSPEGGVGVGAGLVGGSPPTTTTTTTTTNALQPRVCLPDSDEALLYVVRSNGTFVHLDTHIVSANNCCNRLATVGLGPEDLPPPYHTVLAAFEQEEPPPPYGDGMSITPDEVTGDDKKDIPGHNDDRTPVIKEQHHQQQQRQTLTTGEKLGNEAGTDDRTSSGSTEQLSHIQQQQQDSQPFFSSTVVVDENDSGEMEQQLDLAVQRDRETSPHI